MRWAIMYSGMFISLFFMILLFGVNNLFLYAQSNLPVKNMFTSDGALYIGVDYYPEYWPQERWADDMRLMKEAGFNIVRLAEFS